MGNKYDHHIKVNESEYSLYFDNFMFYIKVVYVIMNMQDNKSERKKIPQDVYMCSLQEVKSSFGFIKAVH